MGAIYISEDFYICLSSKEMEILKKQKQTTSFIVLENMNIVIPFLIFIKKEETNLLNFKKNRKMFLVLNRLDFDNLYLKGAFENRIQNQNVYFFIEKHDYGGFCEKSNTINNFSFMITSQKEISTAAD